MFPSVGTAQPHIRAGTVKAYAVLSDARFAGLPDVPTVDEAGVPGVYFSAWSALFAPKGTPKDVIAKLNAALVAALADPSCASGSPTRRRSPRPSGKRRRLARAAEGGHREVVADHEGGEHQGRVGRPAATTSSASSTCRVGRVSAVAPPRA
jgi:hypothetical protein